MVWDADVGVPVGARICGERLVVGSVYDDADVIGRVLRRDTLPIPLPGRDPASPDAFRLGSPRPSYVVLDAPALDGLRRTDASLGRRIPALARALCLPLVMAPTQALASASGSRRSEPEATEDDEIRDTTWNALIDVEITASRGELPPSRGKLLAFDDDTITLSLADGTLATLPRAEVTRVQRHDPPPAPRVVVAPPKEKPEEDEDNPSYKGHVITGSIMVGVGGTIALAGLVMVAVTAANPPCQNNDGSSGSSSGSSLCGDYLGSYPGIWAGGLLAPGLVIVGAGAAVLGVGMKRKKQNDQRRAKAQVRLTPRLQRSAWGGSLQLRF